MKNTLQITICMFALLISTIAAAQCNNEMPEGTYSGETLLGSGGLYGNDDVTVTKSGNTFIISDISAGFIDEIQVLNEDYSLAIEIDCSGNVMPVSKTAIIGPIKITSGTWDQTNNILTFNWTVEISGVSETTKLTYQP